ncbi:hypothetical protein ACIP5T_10860 [Microbacterium sp. NPDC088619]|uniref:hypothetical protein n=1 Tax=Microbacterium sp. NPDC088619 TaxID=3364196 RepID=UPI0038035137
MMDTLNNRSPRSVLVADDSLYLDITGDSDSVALVDDLDAMVVPYSVMPAGNETQVNAVRELLRAAGQLIPGALLIKNPYESEVFEFSEYALESFASAKYHHLATVAKLLGATDVRFEDAKIERQTASTNGGVRAMIPGLGGGDTDVSKEVARKLDARLEGQLTFGGGEPDPEAALEFLRRHNLANDQQLKSLVEMRTGSNPIQGYRMTLSGTRESDANLRAALSIAESVSGKKGINVGASFTREVKSIRSIEITTSIRF